MARSSAAGFRTEKKFTLQGMWLYKKRESVHVAKKENKTGETN